MNDKPIVHIKCQLTQFELGDGSYSYMITVDKNHLFDKEKGISKDYDVGVKESTKNWLGKIDFLDGVSLKELFENNNIKKYTYKGNDEILCITFK